MKTSSNVGCWEYQGDDDKAPVLSKEPLEYEINQGANA